MLFVFDIDGTLLPKGEKIFSKELKACFNELLDKGHVIALASGRPYPILKKMLSEFHPGKKYILAANGTILYDYDGNILYEETLKCSDFIYLYNKYINEHNSIYFYDDLQSTFYTKKDIWIQKEIDINGTTDVFEFDREKDKDINIGKIMIAAPKEYTDKFSLDEEDLKKYHAFKSSREFYEIVHLNAGKKTGVDKLREILNIPSSEVYTFGDEENDLEMIKAYNGVALGNAIQPVKDVAKYITKDVKDNGVCYAIKEILKII